MADNLPDNPADNRVDVNEKKLHQLCLFKERKTIQTTKRTQNENMGYDCFFHKRQKSEPM